MRCKNIVGVVRWRLSISTYACLCLSIRVACECVRVCVCTSIYLHVWLTVFVIFCYFGFYVNFGFQQWYRTLYLFSSFSSVTRKEEEKKLLPYGKRYPKFLDILFTLIVYYRIYIYTAHTHIKHIRALWIVEHILSEPRRHSQAYQNMHTYLYVNNSNKLAPYSVYYSKSAANENLREIQKPNVHGTWMTKMIEVKTGGLP